MPPASVACVAFKPVDDGLNICLSYFILLDMTWFDSHVSLTTVKKLKK
jgi:hypothetical protein